VGWKKQEKGEIGKKGRRQDKKSVSRKKNRVSRRNLKTRRVSTQARGNGNHSEERIIDGKKRTQGRKKGVEK